MWSFNINCRLRVAEVGLLESSVRSCVMATIAEIACSVGHLLNCMVAIRHNRFFWKFECTSVPKRLECVECQIVAESHFWFQDKLKFHGFLLFPNRKCEYWGCFKTIRNPVNIIISAKWTEWTARYIVMLFSFCPSVCEHSVCRSKYLENGLR